MIFLASALIGAGVGAVVLTVAIMLGNPRYTANTGLPAFLPGVVIGGPVGGVLGAILGICLAVAKPKDRE